MAPLKIYVAGPFTKGPPVDNVRTALLAGRRLREKGYYPYVPHLSFFTEMLDLGPSDWGYWMDWHAPWLDACDAVFRVPGESPGADIEVERAQKAGKQIFKSLMEVPKTE